jgi:ribosomal protein L37E
MPRNYNDGRKSCRQCGIFVKTLDNHCICCGYPLATKGRANITQHQRRAEKKISQNTSGTKPNQRIGSQ